MDSNEYQLAAARTLLDAPDSEISDQHIMIVWNALGLAGEAGEIAELVKKGIFHQHGLDYAKLSKELGDCLWYLAGLCTQLGFSMERVMEQNIAKLKERYPEGYTSTDSIARVDTKDTPLTH